MVSKRPGNEGVVHRLDLIAPRHSQRELIEALRRRNITIENRRAEGRPIGGYAPLDVNRPTVTYRRDRVPESALAQEEFQGQLTLVPYVSPFRRRRKECGHVSFVAPEPVATCAYRPANRGREPIIIGPFPEQLSGSTMFSYAPH